MLFQFTPLREGRPELIYFIREHYPISIHAPPRGATKISWLSGRRLPFQFTPLREGRQQNRRGSGRRSYFNSRPSARGDVNEWKGKHSDAISIHAPPRGATRHSRIAAQSYIFQFTPLREGRRIVRFCCEKLKEFQFTPLREGRLDEGKIKPPAYYISIHAPPRGATVHGVCWGYWNLISIHAPPRGATLWQSTVRHGTIYFNSRPSARGDHAGRVHPRQTVHISIHAPPRGATIAGQTSPPAFPSNFNSRPSARGDAAELDGLEGLIVFQFTPLREGRPELLRAQKEHGEFQFTPLREGRPRLNASPSSAYEISIHAPPRGATTTAPKSSC